MENYYVEFLGELKDDQKIQKRFVKHYNKWCKTINQYQEKLNIMFDRQWKGEPIQDYAECDDYQDWMLKQYSYILNKSGMSKDLFMNYEIGDELQLLGIGKYGDKKGKRISFVLKKG